MRKISALLEQKAYKKAHTLCIELIKENLDDPRPYCGLAIIALDHKNIPKALELFETARQKAPNNPFYMAQHAKALSLIGRQNEARELIETAAAMPVDSAHTADMIGVVYSRTGFHEKAIPFFRKAVELDPKPANFHYNLASSSQFSGDFDAAEVSYKDALARDPKLFRAHSSLVALRKQTADDNYLTTLEKGFNANSDDADTALHLGHAIAKTLEDLDQHPESFRWLEKAKAAKYAELSPHIENDLKLFSAAKNTFSNAIDTGEKCMAEPIFIVGLPRTGTTLVDRIVSSHPDVISMGELNAFAEQIKIISETPPPYVMDPETFAQAARKSVTKAGYAYIDQTAELARGLERFTDKMPLNFFNAALIHRALPNARIIALRRGAMDSCLSNYRQLFATKFSYYNYTFDLMDTAKYYRAFDDLMTYWRTHLPPNRFTEIHYEDIVHDQENQTRRLLEFCGLDWNEACMRFHENAAPVSTASSVQVRQPLYSGSIGRWRKYGTALDSLKAALGELANP